MTRSLVRAVLATLTLLATAPALAQAPAAQRVRGTIEAVDGQFATIATANSKVRLPVTAFASGATGPVIGMSAEELDAAASGAAAAAKTGKN